MILLDISVQLLIPLSFSILLIKTVYQPFANQKKFSFERVNEYICVMFVEVILTDRPNEKMCFIV